MAEKRKDNKGRILRTGELQRADGKGHERSQERHYFRAGGGQPEDA